MLNVVDGNLVSSWINEKQQLEVQLAWELLEVFNTDEGLRDRLRISAREALDELKRLKQSSPIASAAITQAWHSQIGIVPLCAKYPAGFNSIRVEQLDAQECSDLVRLYGEFIDKAGNLGAHGGGVSFAAENATRKGLRVGADRWNQNPAADHGRLRDTGAAPGSQVTSDVHSFIVSQQGGGARIRLAPASTVNRMDQVFGLTPVADISGTTTDSLYFTRKFAYSTGPDPVFHMLPLATIVALGHHALLEVALALSINHVVDYRIGFYSTLMPRGAQIAAARIRDALAKAEANLHNLWMLVYYGRGNGASVPNVPAGCFLYERRDHWAFRDFARCVDLLDSFPWLPAWPNESTLRDFCRAKRLRTP